MLRHLYSSSSLLRQWRLLSSPSVSSVAFHSHPTYEHLPYEPIALNNIADFKGAIRRSRRVGRGEGSSKGKTCGKGHKGHRCRSGGGVRIGFEGGQTPTYRRVRKYGGFSNHAHKTEYIPLNLGRIQYLIDRGRLDPSRPITLKTLRDMKIMKKFKDGVKLLGDGREQLRHAIDIRITACSSSARQAVEELGGRVTTIYMSRLSLRHFLRNEAEDIPINFARAPRKVQDRFDIPHYNPKVDIDLQLNQTDDAAVDTEAAEEETLTSPASA